MPHPRALPSRRALLAAALLLPAFPARPQIVGTMARVNGVEISHERFEKYFEDFARERQRNVAAIRNPAAFSALRKEALETLLEEELLFQEATRRKRVASPERVEAEIKAFRAKFHTEEAFRRRLARSGLDDEGLAAQLRRRLSIEQLVEKDILPGVHVDDEDARAYYRDHPSTFVSPEEVHALHVLIKVEPTASPEERARALEAARAVRDRARAGADFAALARERSQDSTATAGGDLGYVPRGQMVAPFEEALFALADGQVSDPVQTVFGYHVIKALDRRGGQTIPEKEVHGRILEYLKELRGREAVRARIQDLRAAARIEILLPP